MSRPPTSSLQQTGSRVVSSPLFVPLALLALCLLVFGDVLTGLRHGVISDSSTDLATEFYYWRDFGFSNLRHGRIPQWNPYVCGGVPFFGGWQTGLLYPPNAIYLILPLNAACNLDLVISTYLTGLFTSLLARKYGLSPLARLLASAVVMLGGAFFSHVYAGHLTTMAAMAWMPLVLLVFDDLLDSLNPRSLLLGIFALSMQILAGHPQTVFNTIVMLVVYVGIRVFSVKRPVQSIAAMLVVGIAAAAIAAVQIVPGLAVSTEGVRSQNVSYDFASEISFEPVNLWTLLAPNIFGDEFHLRYWGPWNKWEMCAFIGIGTLPLVLLGAIAGESPRRRLWITMAVVLSIIAMGCYTPIFRLLYLFVPGFAKFRAYAKFIYPVTIFAAMLAGSGLDALLRKDRNAHLLRNIAGFTAVLAGFCLLATAWMAQPLPGQWFIRYLRVASDSYYVVRVSLFPEFAHYARLFAEQTLIVASVSAIAATILLARSLTTRRAVASLLILILVELVVFDRSTMTTFDPAKPRPAAMGAWLRTHSKEQRAYLTGFLTETAMASKGFDVMGYNPMIQMRWSKFVTRSQVQDPDGANMYVRFFDPTPALALLRCSEVLQVTTNFDYSNYVAKGDRVTGRDKVEYWRIPDPLPHGLMIHKWDLYTNLRDSIERATMRDFPRRKVVLLESPPPLLLRPATGPENVAVTWKNSDTLDIRVHCTAPGVLLITDAYSRFWTPRVFAGSAQHSYHPMPADCALIGVPLIAGEHHFELTYEPPGTRVAGIVSIVALAVFLIACAVIARQPIDAK